jgi:hypothetical protein
MSGGLDACGLGLLPLALRRAGTLKSCNDSKAARFVGAVGKGMKNSCALGSLRVQKRKSRHVTQAAFSDTKIVFGMRLIMHEPS